jgi:hypothetical protein
MPENQHSKFESMLKLFSPLLAVTAFFWGIYTYRENARQQLAREEAEARRTAETRRIEATRPYLDKQLTLYTEATRVTGTIATSSDSKEIEKATRRFWELYWGELGLVEHKNVEEAMVRFGHALDAKKGRDELAPLALGLAKACRKELATSWGTDAWRRE